MEEKFKPYKSGYLPVSDGHELYYECCGNPNGKPVLFLHGGPGAGFSDRDKRFFNLDYWNVILFDQRGSGRSKPFASLVENTTPKLVQDINALLDFLNIEKVFLFGGSWGSTLALAYAVDNIQRVTGMVLRGIFLALQEEINEWVCGDIGQFYPEVWERFISNVPQEKRNNAIEYFLEQMQSTNKTIKQKYAYEWAYYELSLMHIEPTTKEEIEKDLSTFSYLSLSPLEAHYMVNKCFLPENYLRNNAHKLSCIPVSIVNGRYDIICPPKYAYMLYTEITGSTISFVTAGHSSSDPKLEEKLIEEVKRFEK